MTLNKCKQKKHRWETLYNSEGIMDSGGFRIEWCNFCGSIRKSSIFDQRIIDIIYYDIPKYVKNL